MPEPNDNNSEPAAQKPSTGKKLALAMVALIVAFLLVPIGNFFAAPVSGTALTRAASGNARFLEVATLLEANCFDCHSDQGKTPWYAFLPVAGSMIAADQARGTRYMHLIKEMVPEVGRPVPEAALAKLELVLEKGTMPPMRYTALHWNRGLSGNDKTELLAWIREVRSQHYATPGVSPEFKAGALQPLPEAVEVDARKVALGNRLYHDVRLSGDDTVSCASCHGLDQGGCDQRRTSVGIGGTEGPINAPTVYNSGYHFVQFWDGRAANLQEQAAGPVHNPIEMGSNWEQVIPKLRRDEALAAAFTAVYPDGFSGEAITDAIAEFERSLVTPNSRFDQYLKGEANALSAEEVKGYHLFVDSGCATCHVGKNIGGQSFELMGRSRDYFADRGGVGEVDNGRYNVTKDERDRHRFKVPTLRNIAVTQPYLHDGSQAGLADVVNVMVKYQMERPFTVPETAAVVKFLESLTGEYNGELLR